MITLSLTVFKSSVVILIKRIKEKNMPNEITKKGAYRQYELLQAYAMTVNLSYSII